MSQDRVTRKMLVLLPALRCLPAEEVGRQEDPIPGWHDWKRDFASRISSEVKPKGNSNFLCNWQHLRTHD